MFCIIVLRYRHQTSLILFYGHLASVAFMDIGLEYAIQNTVHGTAV